MKEFEGLYLGLSPTDESAVGLGEIEVLIDKEKFKVRIATGLEIQEQEYLLSDFHPMTPEELKRSLPAQHNPEVEVTAFKHFSNFPELWFLHVKDSAPILRLVTGGMGELFCPTILVNSTKGTKDYNLIVSKFEESSGKGAVPRLKNNGRAER